MMNTASSTDQPILTTKSAALSQWTRRNHVSKMPQIGFLLFLLLNAILFIRPMDIFASVKSWPIYEVLSLVCLAVSFRAVIKQFTSQSLLSRPITVCVVGLLIAVALSQISHFQFTTAWNCALEFSKVVVYYLLLVAVVNTPARLRWFLGCTAVFACIHIGMAVVQYHGLIDLPAMRPVEEQARAKENGEIITRFRMCGAGLFHDPNDLSVLAATTIMLCLFPLVEFDPSRPKGWWAAAFFSLLALLLCGYGLILTESRGGFIALMAGLAIFSLMRFGLKRSLIVAAVALPVIAGLFSARQTDFHMMRRTTAQLRMGFWVRGLDLFKHSPIFGIGQGNFQPAVGYVAHNSFVQSFTELGFFGGTLFLGAFFLALWPIYLLSPRYIVNSDLNRLRPYFLAMLITWVVGMMSLSRSYVPPTYMLLGVATVYLLLTDSWQPRVNGRLAARLIGLSLIFLAGVYVFIRVFHRGS